MLWRTLLTVSSMAGKGSEIGGNFQELAEIISRVRVDDKIGVCLDTCHARYQRYDYGGQIKRKRI